MLRLGAAICLSRGDCGGVRGSVEMTQRACRTKASPIGRFRGSERLTDFPMKAERVDQAPDAPAVPLADRINLGGAGGYGLGEGGIGIGNGEDQAEILAAEWFGAGSRSVSDRSWAFVAQPELGAVSVETDDETAFGRS